MLSDDQAKFGVINAIKNLSIEKPMVVTIEPLSKRRSTKQNSLQWVSLLGDMSMQVEIEGRKFLPDIWHEQLKRQFLPEHENPEFTMPGYKKWTNMPDGSLKMTGSTKKLTKLGMENYLHECYAYAAGELGVRFSANV